MTSQARHSLALLLAAAACASPARTSGQATAATQRAPAAAPAPLQLDRHESEIRAFETADRARMPAPGGIVFTGSSSIRMWRSLVADFAGLPVLNRGFGGSTLPEVNHYFSRVVTPYRPRPEYFVGDSLHMTPAGYVVWRAQLAPHVR